MALSKEEFVDAIKEIRAVVASDECKKCSCPNVNCELHGDCYNCIRVYRHFGSHIPRCLQFILEKKIAKIIECAESEFLKRPNITFPDSYYEYLNSVAPKKGV